MINENLINDEIKNFVGFSEDKQLEKINEMRKDLIRSKEENDPDDILHENIKRANTLLDILQNQIQDESPEKKHKGSKARLFEVSAQLINSITNATTSIVGTSKDDFEQEYKLQLLELEKQKLAVKFALNGGKDNNKQIGTVNNNLIVTDRQSLLNMIKDEED